MMSDRRWKLKSEIFRTDVRRRLDAGESISSIAKSSGRSYRHTKLIAEQEQHAAENGISPYTLFRKRCDR